MKINAAASWRGMMRALLLCSAVQWGAVALAEEPIRLLLVTGYNHPAHDWRQTTPAVLDALREDRRFETRVVEDPLFLESSGLKQYHVILLNFADFMRESPGERALVNLREAVESGVGLIVLHFANGAWDERADYRDLVARVWQDGESGHDAYGAFRVTITDVAHPITAGLEPFDTTDELYFRLVGTLPVEVLCTARSQVTGQDEPMAMVFTRGQGRVFHTTLGHDAAALRHPGPAELLRRGSAWAAGREVQAK